MLSRIASQGGFLCALAVAALPAHSGGVAVGTAEATAVPGFSTAPIPITFRAIRDASENGALPKSVAAQSDEQNLAMPRPGDIESLLGASALSGLTPSSVQKSVKIATSKQRFLQVDAKCGTQFNVTGYTTSNYMVYSTDVALNESNGLRDRACMTSSRGKNTGDLSILGSAANLVLISSTSASTAAEKHLVIVVNFN